MPGKTSPSKGAFDRRTTMYLSILERKIREGKYVDGAELAVIFAGNNGNGCGSRIFMRLAEPSLRRHC